MANKSDSAGKLHQFFTCIYLNEKFPDAILDSPLNDNNKLKEHSELFLENEILSIKKIGKLSAELICDHVNNDIVEINDIGVNSGATGNTITDDIKVKSIDNSFNAYSLKCAKNLRQILSKNMGAKSLLEKYFNAKNEQLSFNNKFDGYYIDFLNSILNTNETNISILKKKIDNNAINVGLTKARFADKIYSHANESRTNFLRLLRDELGSTIKQLNKSQILNACNLILDSGKNHIIAEYNYNKEKASLDVIPWQESQNYIINKRGNDSITISISRYTIGFRFKFESGITSSIKLVGDYKKDK
ncbi:hypothetical protein [uncultured Tenacibaculum sp.]|uniref:hypothetical protein n=1 Tax=uncultured Tenacibaculum sp. TaxID=174713 RepID=UPI0026338B33|nr:hypothetical protein [uncultured Tenacibaculum sp.]